MGLTPARALRLGSAPSVAFVGAGGKTTAMFHLARDLVPPLIVTATTHLGASQTSLADRHIVVHLPQELANINIAGVTLVTGPVREDQRAEAINHDTLHWLHEETRRRVIPLLIEADGSRQRPLKAPAEHEPAIPEFVSTLVVVAGLSALGKPLTADFVHRPEIFSKLGGLNLGEPITSEAMVHVLTHPHGGLKNIPTNARRVVLLNQADTLELQASARGMVHSLLSAFDAVIIAELQEKVIYAVREPVAGIILAAGEAKRFGQLKQLLDWHGEPFVRAVAKTALNAGLHPVVIVTGADAEKVEAAVQDLPARIAQNREWRSGQASSVRAGVKAFPEGTGAAIFLLADQPQMQSSVIRALVEAHAAELNPIVAPLVLMEQRANPVLFDRVTFPDLLSLEGDVGGRAIFSKHPVEYMPWHDDRLLLDVDKPEDYQRLLDSE